VVIKQSALIVCAGLLCSACASNAPLDNSQKGAAIGAITGAILGHKLDGDRGGVVGAVAGAIAGGAVGSYMDQQQAALEEELRQERESDAISIQRLDDDSLQLNLSSEVSFDVNSAKISADFYPSLSKMASVLNDYPGTAIHVLGHTDSSGSAEYNLGLSRKRAWSVTRFLESQSVVPTRIRAIGRGEAYPVADNSTADGRSRNRRVEIVLKPIVKGRELRAFKSPTS